MRMTTVYRNGRWIAAAGLTAAQERLLQQMISAGQDEPVSVPPRSDRDAEIVSRQTRARRYRESRTNVPPKDGVERLAGCG